MEKEVFKVRQFDSRANHQRHGNGKIGHARLRGGAVFYEFWPSRQVIKSGINMILTPAKRLRDAR